MPRNSYEMMIHMKMLDAGIVPFGIVPADVSVEVQLEGVDPARSRQMKRKFRKLWRKAYKKYQVESEKLQNDSKITRNEKSRRLHMVYHDFRESVLNEMKL